MKAIIIAGAIGAGLMIVIGYAVGEPGMPTGNFTTAAAIGFGIGAGVQIGVRVAGVS